MVEQTVFIIDDDDAVRDSINELMESIGLKTKAFKNAVDFLEQYDGSQRGCIVSDIMMAGLSGLALQKQLNQLESALPIIFITGYSDISVVSEAFKGGAYDVLGKPYHELQLLDTINAALQKEKESQISISEKDKFQRNVENLTTRELEVLGLVAEGMTNKVIAKQLQISPRTVEIHRQRALLKVGTRSINKIKEYLVG